MSKNKRVRKTKRHEAKINKRILKERREKKKGRIGILIILLFFSSPLWFYRGIMHEIVLPIWGERDKAVLSGTMRPRPWSGRYATPDYSYSFYKNGTLYVKNSAISVENTSYHLGDSVDIMYLELMPFISSCVSPKR
mgnify:CR=1 FL=1|jgi:hypothetical protein